ncbi:MAG: pitrilysin family protein, partial [bacterium]
EKAKQLADLKIEADQPTILARNATRQAIFGKHPYAMNPLGSETTLSSIQRADIAAYHRQLMNSGNVTLFVGGSFDPEKMTQLLNKHFEALPKGDKPRQPEPVAFPEKNISQTIPTPKEQAIVQIAYPGVEMDNKDRPALEVLDEAFSDLGSPFFIRIREKQSLAYFVGSSQMIGLHRGYFVFYAGVAPQNSEKAKTEILDEIRLIVGKGLSPEEISRAQAKLVGQRLLTNQSAASVAYRAALNELYGLGAHFEEEMIKQIQALTPEQINAAAARYFSTPNFVLTIVQPVQQKKTVK